MLQTYRVIGAALSYAAASLATAYAQTELSCTEQSKAQMQASRSACGKLEGKEARASCAMTAKEEHKARLAVCGAAAASRSDGDLKSYKAKRSKKPASSGLGW
jgi:hypothetical protein